MGAHYAHVWIILALHVSQTNADIQGVGIPSIGAIGADTLHMNADAVEFQNLDGSSNTSLAK